MKKLAILFFLIYPLLAFSQEKKPVVKDIWKKRWFNQNFTVELPVFLGFELHRNIGNTVTGNIASGILNQGYWDWGFAGFGLGVQSQGRMLGIAWQDRAGVEVGISFYRKQIDFEPYYQQFAVANPGYYVSGIQPWDKSYGIHDNKMDMQFFSGFNWGVYYNFPIGRFYLQPHINASFKNWYLSDATAYTTSTYKQQGSNNTLDSHISTTLLPNKGAWFVQLWLISRPKQGEDFFIKHVNFEYAFRVLAGVIPYNYVDTITTKPYNQPMTQQIIPGIGSQFYFNVGFLLTGVRLLNK